MVDKTAKATNWTVAFTAAEKHPDGELINVHGATLRAMEKAGSVYRRGGKWYMKGKGPGPVEEPKIEEPEPEEPAEVTYKVQDASTWMIHLDVTGAPDTTHPDHPGGALRPAGVTLGIGVTDGVWTVGVSNVFGQKVKGGKVATKRNYPLAFVDPLDEESAAPEWLRKVCQDWVDRANGKGRKEDFDELLERSSLGAPRVKVAQEEVPQEVKEKLGEMVSSWEIVRRVRADRVRDRFEGALSALLTRENLQGSQWAIRRLTEEADAFPDNSVAEALREIARRMSVDLDKRAAELSARES
jgi:hypothetical protein